MKYIVVMACIILASLGCSMRYPSENAVAETERSMSEDVVRLEHCMQLNTERKIWVAAATVGGSLATGAGTITPIINAYVTDDRDGWVIGVSVTGIVGAGLSILGVTMASEVNDEWVQYHCDDFI